MTLFVATKSWVREGAHLLGVFDNVDRAKEACQKDVYGGQLLEWSLEDDGRFMGAWRRDDGKFNDTLFIVSPMELNIVQDLSL